MIDKKINNLEEGVLTVANDYRQIAIIEDPVVYNETRTISNTVVSQLTVLSMAQSSSTTNYQEDEWVYQGTNLANATFKGIVVDWDFPNNSLKLSNVTGTPTSDLITGNTTTTTRYVSSILTPDMQPYSGKLLYIDHIVPIERSIDQNEEFKILLSF